jgi:hypothetical protein
MALGLSAAALEQDIQAELRKGPVALDEDQAKDLARIVAVIIDKNNREIERELGRRIADIERKIGRT